VTSHRSDEGATGERSAPGRASRLFAEAINAGDLDGALARWSPAGVIVAPDGSETRGHAALSERFAQLIASKARLEIRVCEEVCTALGATARTRMTMIVPSAAGTTAIEVEGQVVYVPGSDGLQILIDRLLSTAG
jgi:ketosteroid isomerase-like protein